MSYIDELIEHGTNFQVRRSEDGASFTPASRDDKGIEAFQAVVRDLHRHEGEGYSIHLDHKLGDHGHGLIDLVVVSIERK